MTKLVGRILSCLCMGLLLGSCIFEYPPELEDNKDNVVDKNKVVLHLNIQSLASSASGNPTEKIKSLRVVIIGKGENESVPDTVECNRLVAVPEMVAKDFSYVLMWNSKPGNKDIFVIANEKSVDEGITAILDGYAEEKPAKDFIEWVNGYSFSPHYTPDGNNDIYLPYTFSKEDLAPREGVVNTVNAWLIPVATKFIFNFTNNRPNGIKVNGISMKYANRENYLLAKPGDGELIKEYNGQYLSWTDWLAEISKNSWLYPDFSGNEGYNDEVGWIVDYKLPNPEDSDVYTFVKENTEGEIFTVSGASTTTEEGIETTIPGKYSTPVYYLPESANFVIFGADQQEQSQSDGEGQEGETTSEQRFYLTMLFEDTAVPATTVPVFEDIPIPNLKALFRNTYVIINVTMSEGDIELYAEIAQWNVKTANGWVNEGDAPSNNPFKIRKKW